MTKYKNKYADVDFLWYMSDDPISTPELMRRLGCCRNTALSYLSELQKAGKIKKISIIGSRNYGWVLGETKNR